MSVGARPGHAPFAPRRRPTRHACSRTGLVSGHHEPDCWHRGDGPRCVVDATKQLRCSVHDWGVQQLNATIDRPDIDARDWAANVSYGRHKLHHLFPTVDHTLLPQLLPVVRETCREFGLTMGIEKTQREMCRGVWQQARREDARPENCSRVIAR